MLLELDRPLIVFDLETTGTNPLVDRIVEIAALKLFPDGRRDRFESRVNPERLIPAEATAVHGISNEDIKGAPTFGSLALRLLRFLGNADLAGFGIIRFDVPLLGQEFRRVGLEFGTANIRLVDAQRIYHRREPRDLTAALRFYCGLEHRDAHSAGADTEATLQVLEGQIGKYPDLPRSVAELDALCNPRDPQAIDPDGKIRWQDGEAVIAFGQKSGCTLRDLAQNEPGYLRWITNKDFSPEVKALAADALDGKFPQR